MNQDLFCFQRLKAYQHARAGLKVIVDNAGAFRGLPGDLGPQMHHAAVSCALNIAEPAEQAAEPGSNVHIVDTAQTVTNFPESADLALFSG